MNPQGIDPYAYMEDVSGRIDRSEDVADLERMLDGLEYLYEVLDPQLQDLAEALMQRLRNRLASIRGG